MQPGIHLDLDGAWESGILGIPTLDLRDWGPRLRYSAPRSEMAAFCRQVEGRLAPFILFGSGDFHHLAGALVHRMPQAVTLVSFDNHPDWDVRSLAWGCGGWINRALESGRVDRAVVWGCANFEVAWPHRLFANRSSLRNGRLVVRPWAERQSARTLRRYDAITADNWRQQFDQFADEVAGADVYVTIDLDCLRREEAITNWENGLFAAADLVWALGRLHDRTRILGGDLCGGWSRPVYARWTQRVAGYWDHPRLAQIDGDEARSINHATLEAIWPALVGRGC